MKVTRQQAIDILDSVIGWGSDDPWWEELMEHNGFCDKEKETCPKLSDVLEALGVTKEEQESTKESTAWEIDMNFEQFIKECRKGGLERAKKLLRKFVIDGEPENFCDGATSRAMCREASNAITGEKNTNYIETKYGCDLYFHMWGGE